MESVIPFDWLSVVIIPLVMSVVIGIPLALLTGFVAARYLEWHRVKASALHEFLRIPEGLGDAAYSANPFGVSNFIHYFMHDQPLELQNAGQASAAKEFTIIRDEMNTVLKAAINSIDPYVLLGLRNSEQCHRVVTEAGKVINVQAQSYLVRLYRSEPSLNIFFTGAIADIVHIAGAKRFAEQINDQRDKKEDDGNVH